MGSIKASPSCVLHPQEEDETGKHPIVHSERHPVGISLKDGLCNRPANSGNWEVVINITRTINLGRDTRAMSLPAARRVAF